MHQHTRHSYSNSFYKESKYYKNQSKQVSKDRLPYHPTILHALLQNVQEHPDHVFAHWLDQQGKIINKLTYQQIWLRSILVKDLLNKKAIQRGDRVMIAFPFGLDFLEAFLGCMLAGVIPCSVYPPNPQSGMAKFSFDQFNTQAADAGAKYALTTQKFALIMKGCALRGLRTKVSWLSTNNLDLTPQFVNHLTEKDLPDPQSVGFIQYSSGSTSTPKGIVLSHGAVAHNQFTANSVTVSNHEHGRAVCWLPQYHDFGLNIFLTALYTRRLQVYNFSPIDFIKNPLMWADAIDEFQATHLGGPNFGFSLLHRRMKTENRVLKHGHLLKRIQMGAEPIRPDTLNSLESIGVPSSAFMPSYGMAESSVFVTSCVGQEIRVVDGVVSCGLLERNEAFDKFLVIADPKGSLCEDGVVGEIFIRGPDLADGYWGKPELDDRFECELDDGMKYFATGDLGKIIDGRLFVTGRCKELIIVNGKNVYPTDIERTLEHEFSDHVRPGCTAAFQMSESKIGVVMELREGKGNRNAVQGSGFNGDLVFGTINGVHGVQIEKIVALKKGGIPKTTSGKIRRVEAQRRTHESDWSSKKMYWSWSPNLGSSSRNLKGSIQTENTEELPTVEAILNRVLGEKLDMNKSWTENGLGSMTQIELTNVLADELHASLPPTFVEDFPTPQHLKQWVETTNSCSFQIVSIDLEDLQIKHKDDGNIGCCTAALVQFVGIIFMLCTFVGALLVAYVVAKYTVELRQGFTVDGTGYGWSWIPLILPCFMLSLTLTTIAIKWVVVGRYRPTVAEVRPLPSSTFLKWWLVDRVVDMWEFWVGRYIMDTPLIWLAYTFMGASIHPTATIDGFIREFDLVTIGSHSSLRHRLRCRKFSSWNEEDGLSVRFRPIVMGSNCDIKGMVSLGADIGDNSTVTKLSVVPEGAIVPEQSVADGNPASQVKRNTDELQDESKESVGAVALMGLLKVCWLVGELYLFHGFILMSQLVWNDSLPADFRYTLLLYWILLLTLVSVFSITFSVVMKWTLIGRRRGKSSTFTHRLVDWICDYHFRVSTAFLVFFSSNSKMWNVVLKLHGMDIDMASSVSLGSLVPSKMNSVKVERSFVATGVLFERGDSTTEVINSSIGYFGNVHGGIRIVGSLVPPMVCVRDGLEANEIDSSHSDEGVGRGLLREALYLMEFVVVGLSLVPSFEVFNGTVYDEPVGIAVVGVLASVVCQCLVWTVLLRVFQWVLHTVKWHDVLFQTLYQTFLTYGWAVRTWSLWLLLWGTPFFSWLLCFMGTKVEGEVLYFGDTVFDLDYLSIGAHTVVDGAFVSAHHQVHDDLTVAPTRVGGVLHEGSYPAAGVSLESGTSYGPWRVLVATATKVIGDPDKV